ncbi:MAG: TetR/AcrR family transcriptional regulator [Bacteroidales bacterium]|nr:TetR/AcrR family transcriptional regulator [Bacteroidales bacterium]MCF8389617.1 TetR/AcrR family transcriptional regulator [Bacteroidales bacterium]
MIEANDTFYLKVGELYRKYGVKSVTMDDIARELGMSKKTLYSLVTDKRDLIEKILEVEFSENLKGFVGIQSSGQNAIEELFSVHNFMKSQLKFHSHAFEYDLKKYYPEIYNSLMEKKREVMYKSVLENINRGKKEGIYRMELKGELISSLYIARMESTKDNNVLSLEYFITPEIFQEYLIYHIRGIANNKGIEILEHYLERNGYNVTI